MNLNELPSIKVTSLRRLGRGPGSGRGKTSGRGTKGQKARRKIPLYFEGGARSLVKRLPFRRGHGTNRSLKNDPLVINVKDLNLLPAGAVVDLELLIAHNIVDAHKARVNGVKILGDGKLSQVVTVKLPVSKTAQTKVEKAGGTVELKG